MMILWIVPGVLSKSKSISSRFVFLFLDDQEAWNNHLKHNVKKETVDNNKLLCKPHH